MAFVEPPKDREPERALKYLARYTYRVAISNQRLESIEGKGPEGRVTFWYKVYAARRHLGPDDPLRRGVPPTSDAARLAARLCADPPVRLPGQPPPRGRSWPSFDACCRPPCPDRTRPQPLNRQTTAPPLPVLWRARLEAAR